jgi:predicted transcriptional regulator
MRYVNLSTAVARKYLKILMENGLIEEKNGEYLLTEKGKQALALLREERKLELELALLINDLEKIFF